MATRGRQIPRKERPLQILLRLTSGLDHYQRSFVQCDRCCVLTLLGHSDIETFLQPTGLTAVPRHLVDDTHFVSMTRVHHVLLDASPKEALTKHKGLSLT